VARAGDIGLFHILGESGVAAGVRRIEAVTGAGALAQVARNEQRLREVAGLLRGSTEEVTDKVREQLDRVRALEKELRALKDKLASGQGTDLAAEAISVGNSKIVAARVEGADVGALRAAVDQLKSRLGSAVIVLASVESESRAVVVAGVTADLTARIKAGELVSAVSAELGGKGGGRPDFAQGGGTHTQHLGAALKNISAHIRGRLTEA
jgi:alanyl-tRNA synthetase